MDINQIIKQHTLWLETDGKEGSRANLTEANLYGANLTEANLCGVDLTEANLCGTNLEGVNLTEANLCGTNLEGVNLTGANLYRANLEGVNLTGANLYRANLTRTNLEGVNLCGANLYRANLNRTNLTHTNLEGVNLCGANLYGAIGDLKHIKSIFCDTYTVTYTAEVMQIGCQRHNFEDWWDFSDARILDMGGKSALTWWKIWKPILQQIIEASPATATGYVELK